MKPAMNRPTDWISAEPIGRHDALAHAKLFNNLYAPERMTARAAYMYQKASYAILVETPAAWLYFWDLGLFMSYMISLNATGHEVWQDEAEEVGVL